MHWRQPFIKFWSCYPALFYGIVSLLGLYAHFYGSPLLLIPALFLWLPFIFYPFQRTTFQSLLLSFSLFFGVWAYAAAIYPLPQLPEKGISGTAHLSIQSVSSQKSPFGKKWVYQVCLNSFFPDAYPSESIATHLKCIVTFPYSEEIQRPKADQDYLVKGKLLPAKGNYYPLKISVDDPWQVVEGSWSWTEWRVQWKNRVADWIHQQYDDQTSAQFLAGLATGHFDDPWMRQEFSRFGLQHIMAISGFHFAIMAGVLSFILRLILPRKWCMIALLFLMGSYCFFLGSNPSVIRAWIMCSLALLCFLLEKQSSSLNTLGVAMLGVLAIDPLFSLSMAFQFSFLTTAAILLAYSPIDHLLCQVFLKRPLQETSLMDGWNQHAYIILALFRQGLSLTMAVNLFALPISFYFFQQFSLMGIPYNFFFPFLVTGSLCFMILGTFIPWFHAFNNAYTSTILKLTYQLPSSADHYLSIEELPTSVLILLICLCCASSIALRHYLETEKEEFYSFI